MSELDASVQEARTENEHLLVVRHPRPGVLTLAGPDGLDLLHRLSTNDLEDLPIWSRRVTVFTNAVGRVVDVTHVLHREDDLLLVTSPGRAEVVKGWIGRHIFFQDDVRFAENDADREHAGVYGEGATDALIRALGEADLPTGEQLRKIPGGLLWRVEEPGSGFELLSTGDMGPPLAELLASASAETSARYESLRIERGIPRFGHEVTEQSIPLEAGLRDAINFNKGCYVGQEIIARMHSRGRTSRRLIGVRLLDQAEAGALILLENKEIGRLTSAARSESLGWIGLAIIRSSYEPGAEVSIGDTDGRLCTLPFTTN